MRDLGIFSCSEPGSYMVSYIRQHFANVLGPYVTLLDEPGGLDLISKLIRDGEIGSGRKQA